MQKHSKSPRQKIEPQGSERSQDGVVNVPGRVGDAGADALGFQAREVGKQVRAKLHWEARAGVRRSVSHRRGIPNRVRDLRRSHRRAFVTSLLLFFAVCLEAGGVKEKSKAEGWKCRAYPMAEFG